ncbi:hypothetical protein E8E15_008875 [Penicillium rubens]|uniref:Pc22g15010 protein n=2 Tax=Penicillium chrysogenum species complex TaxID=254878 RepID=B6HVM0_PENRW|nr:uncharacterized protein N7525_004877 [Penicillium rubens]KZN91083.1 hypothetical protein EN45_012110 [Penicillium chrysogenum]CAP98789.1 Pc22g15010 [Penicillium rubens Wisconsin 54-1255]KAF3027421.1 hypothetical protein E8E15_008875 [Penicillium rubens]KAJ5044393.1 hypothetical protein NUH16_001195 [Penicillium rubens]KAJ5839689.1 hypothetical protein N7525_004877 [Penicillium rubens]
MFVRSVLLGGAAALGASAMLVVPEMEPKVDMIEDGFVNVHPMLLEDVHHAIVDLPCSECPLRETNDEGVVTWAEGKPSSLTLDFSIEDNCLLANGRQIFPPAPPIPILAVQQNEEGEDSNPMPVGYALEIMPMAAPSDEPGYELLDIRFTVLDLETHPVPVDTVAITVLQDPNGELFIARTEIENTTPASDRLSWKECNGKAKCLQELLVSRIRGLLAGAKARVMGMTKTGRKSCHGKHKGKTMGHYEQGHDGMPFPFPPPFGEDGRHHAHAHGSARPHHHHPYHGAFARTFSRIVHFIVIPAVLGVLAGLTASAIGMLVGQAVVFLWQRYRGTTSSEHKAAWEDGEACEKQGLVTIPRPSEEVLPEYTGPSRNRASLDKI